MLFLIAKRELNVNCHLNQAKRQLFQRLQKAARKTSSSNNNNSGNHQVQQRANNHTQNFTVKNERGGRNCQSLTCLCCYLLLLLLLYQQLLLLLFLSLFSPAMQCKPRCQGAVRAFLFAFDLHKSQSRLNFTTLPRPSPWANAAFSARESQRAEQPKQVARKPHTVPPARKLSKNKQHHVLHVDPSPSTGECTQAHSHSLTHAARTPNTKSERGEHQKKLTRNAANKASN